MTFRGEQKLGDIVELRCEEGQVLRGIGAFDVWPGVHTVRQSTFGNCGDSHHQSGLAPNMIFLNMFMFNMALTANRNHGILLKHYFRI